MSDINLTSTERFAEEEDAINEKSKDFLISLLKWSFALLGVKDLLINMQATFIAIAIALITLFVIRSRTTQSNRGTTFINFAFLILGCLVVVITIDSIVVNSYIKWVIDGMLFAMVAVNPDYQQVFQETGRIFKSKCEATFLRLRNLFIQSQAFIENLLKINVADGEQSSMNNNPATPPDGGDEGGGGVGEDIV